MSNLTPCEQLVTRAEFDELKAQINQLLGQPEDPNGQAINVLQTGSLAGTLVGSGLVFDLEIVENATTKATEIFKKSWGGIRSKASGATRGLSKISSTAKGAFGAAGAALKTNAALMADVGNLGIGLTNLAVTKVLESRLTEAENANLRLVNDFGNIYSHLTTANGNIAQANENINQLEIDLTDANTSLVTLNDSLIDQQIEAQEIADKLEQSIDNNAILKNNVITLENNFDEYEEWATEEISILKSNTQALKNSLQINEENNDKILSLAENLGIQVAGLEGRSTELEDRMTRLSYNQTFNRIELINLQSDFDNQRDLIDAYSVSHAARIRVLEQEVRRKGGAGGSIPASVQSNIASQQNQLTSLASALTGNPSTVQDQTTGEEIPIQTNLTYQDILYNSADITNTTNSLISTVPDITNLSSTGAQVTPDELATFGDDLIDRIFNGENGQMQLVLGASVLPAIAQVRNQTTPAAITSATTTAICNQTGSGGCLTNNILNPIKNNLSGLGQAIGLGADGLNLGLNYSIIGRLTTMQTFLNNAWNSTGTQRLLTTANTVLALHNATMLSRNLGQSVGDTATLILNGLDIKTHDDREINVNNWVSNKATSFATAIVGEDNYELFGKGLNSANRILTAGQGMVSAVGGVRNAIQEGQEIIANRVGTLGNTMMDQGLFEDSSFEFMSTNTNFRNPFNRFTQRVENITEFVEEINQLVQTGIEVQEGVNEFFENAENAVTASQELQTAFAQFNEEKQEENDEAEADSASPVIANSDLIQRTPSEE